MSIYSEKNKGENPLLDNKPEFPSKSQQEGNLEIPSPTLDSEFPTQGFPGPWCHNCWHLGFLPCCIILQGNTRISASGGRSLAHRVPRQVERSLCHSLAYALGILLHTLGETSRVGIKKRADSVRRALSLPCPPTANVNDVISPSCVFTSSCIPPVHFAPSLSTCTNPPSGIVSQVPELANPLHNSTCRLWVFGKDLPWAGVRYKDPGEVLNCVSAPGRLGIHRIIFLLIS